MFLRGWSQPEVSLIFPQLALLSLGSHRDPSSIKTHINLYCELGAGIEQQLQQFNGFRGRLNKVSVTSRLSLGHSKIITSPDTVLVTVCPPGHLSTFTLPFSPLWKGTCLLQS